jgi:hypothetical protein
MDGGSGINVPYASMLEDMGILWSQWGRRPHHSMGSSAWRHSPLGRSICPSCWGLAKLSHCWCSLTLIFMHQQCMKKDQKDKSIAA